VALNARKATGPSPARTCIGPGPASIRPGPLAHSDLSYFPVIQARYACR
jgi:hypothetical protein